MRQPVVKAFVICDEVIDSPTGPGPKDLYGAGLALLESDGLFPWTRTFWVYLELAGQNSAGSVQLALMRADSGRRFFFRSLGVDFEDPLHSAVITIRLYECLFPAPGVYFLELWYDNQWQLDQRLEVV